MLVCEPKRVCCMDYHSYSRANQDKDDKHNDQEHDNDEELELDDEELELDDDDEEDEDEEEDEEEEEGTMDDDDVGRMELADFDSSFFDCWADESQDDAAAVAAAAGRTPHFMNSIESCHSPPITAPAEAITTTMGAAGLPNFALEEDYQASLTALTSSDRELASSLDGTENIMSMGIGQPTTFNNDNSTTETQLHPLAIQSSAKCPNPNGTSGTTATSTTATANTTNEGHATSTQLSENQTIMNPALLPLAFNALAAGLTPIYFPAPPREGTTTGTTACTTTKTHDNNNTNNTNKNINNPNKNTNKKLPSSKAPVATASGRQRQSNRGKKKKNQQGHECSNGKGGGDEQGDDQPPPFLLFDAPVELRTNFIQSQISHGLPVMEDNNSYHFGMSVGGFHPQGANTNAKVNADNVRLIDARHAGSKRLKNAKEQKRAQKITDLIDHLRVKMENGGWKVGLKSKFHTLSSCADYVKHLVKVNQEKEEAVNRAKSDLEAKRRKLEEDKAQQDPSDPESTTSSLTASSGSGRGAERPDTNANQVSEDKGSNDDSNKGNTTSSDKSSKRQTHHMSSLGSTISSATSSGADDSGKQKSGIKSMSVDQGLSSISDITDSNKDSSCSGHVPPANAAAGTLSSSRVNNNNNNNKEQSQQQQQRLVPGEEGRASVGGTVSSDAAVAGNETKQKHHQKHRDVVVQGRKKHRKGQRPPVEEKTSLDENFELDYEEVFLRSNVPQLLASTSGKILSWNDFFLKATGLAAEEVERLTIFSLVESSKLSNLFEIVAAALRESSSGQQDDNETERGEDNVETQENGNSDNNNSHHIPSVGPTGKRRWDYEAITLPCISFQPGAWNDGKSSTKKKPKKPLYMTVTLMTDEDPRKRCFHCVFTDCPGTNGALGTITPEMLALLFSSKHSVDAWHTDDDDEEDNGELDDDNTRNENTAARDNRDIDHKRKAADSDERTENKKVRVNDEVDVA